MNTPWVSRTLYDVARALLEAGLRDAQQLVAARDAEIVRLTDVIVAMKRQGYQPPEPPPAPVQHMPPSPVELAVRANIPARLRNQVYSEVALWRNEGLTDEQIIQRIRLGEEGYRATR